MITAGDVLEHPVTGERLVVRQTARDTDGALFQADFYMRPGGFEAGEHIHPIQEERFEIFAGTLHGRVAGKEVFSRPGETLVIPRGTPHVFWNDGADELHVLMEFRPALQIERFFETFFGLAQDGKVSRKSGLANPLQMSLVMRRYRKEMILARPPRLVQTVLFGALASIGRLLGYRAEYPYPQARRAPAQPQTS